MDVITNLNGKKISSDLIQMSDEKTKSLTNRVSFNYSSSEQWTGRYCGDKKIYGIHLTGTLAQIVAKMNTLGIEKVFLFVGEVIGMYNNTWFINSNYQPESKYNTQVFRLTSTLKWTCNYGDLIPSTSSAYLTLEYTKING